MADLGWESIRTIKSREKEITFKRRQPKVECQSDRSAWWHSIFFDSRFSKVSTHFLKPHTYTLRLWFSPDTPIFQSYHHLQHVFWKPSGLLRYHHQGWGRWPHHLRGTSLLNRSKLLFQILPFPTSHQRQVHVFWVTINWLHIVQYFGEYQAGEEGGKVKVNFEFYKSSF